MNDLVTLVARRAAIIRIDAAFRLSGFCCEIYDQNHRAARSDVAINKS